jgi:hypothetical protein
MSQTPVVSEVASAGLIVHLRVESDRLGPWRPAGAHGRRERRGTLGLQVVEVLKGRLDATAGDVVDVPVVTRGSASGVVLDRLPIWAHISTAPGSELVAFCDGATTDLAGQLTEEHCDQLVPAATVLDDLHLALGLQARHLTTAALLAEAGRLRAEGGPLFARWIWVTLRDALVASPERFGELMRIAEDPATRTDAQDAYLRAAYEDATVTMEHSREQRARLARAMLRAALDPANEPLRDPLVGTFIPNLVGAEVPEPLAAAEVFGDRAELERQVRTAELGGELAAWLAPDGGEG